MLALLFDIHGNLPAVGPGSVGMPMDGDHRAGYTLLHDNGRIERRRVVYEHRASAVRIREVAGNGPCGEAIARRIEQAAQHTSNF